MSDCHLEVDLNNNSNNSRLQEVDSTTKNIFFHQQKVDSNNKNSCSSQSDIYQVGEGAKKVIFFSIKMAESYLDNFLIPARAVFLANIVTTQ